MMSVIRDLLSDLADFERTAQSYGDDLKLDFADVILRTLRDKGWTQAQLAKAAGMEPPYVTRVVHASQNCTFEVAGRLLHALGVRARLMEASGRTAVYDQEAAVDEETQIIAKIDNQGSTGPLGGTERTYEAASPPVFVASLPAAG